MNETSFKIADCIAGYIFKNCPYNEEDSILTYLKKLKVIITFDRSNPIGDNWTTYEKGDYHYIKMNYSEEFIGAYKINYEILEAFISFLYDKKNNDFREVSNYVICYLLTKNTLKEQLIKVYEDEAYDLSNFSYIYKIPEGKILWYLREKGYIC